MAIEVEQVQEVVGSGGGGGAQQHGGETDAAGGTRSVGAGGGVGVGVSGAGEGGDEVVQSGVELGDLCCGGALLGPEHRCGAGESEQRAGDVAGDDEVDPIKIDCAAVFDTVDAVQVLSGGGQQLAGAVEEAVTQRSQHADSTVGAGAAAQRQHQPCAGQCQRCSDGFAEAVTRRGHRGEHPAGQGG